MSSRLYGIVPNVSFTCHWIGLNFLYALSSQTYSYWCLIFYLDLQIEIPVLVLLIPLVQKTTQVGCLSLYNCSSHSSLYMPRHVIFILRGCLEALTCFFPLI